MDKQIGIWSEQNPTAPWDWRKNRKIIRPNITEEEVRRHNIGFAYGWFRASMTV
jgi:hypothetical protein